MTIELWSLGKSDKKELSEGIAMYAKRLQYYTKFKLETIDNSKINKNLPKPQILEKETALVLSKLEDKDLLI
ncbi:MAG: 23S rRNA (pseudouridine(1915)-N(3))-methyltransferase RlmH, partial [Chitinophagaceae bacterium]|nr:23S rRNA (pseudouridine(1915)-N(3))-methyltransferase RlmH [Chitinophagaceae bacterium]